MIDYQDLKENGFTILHGYAGERRLTEAWMHIHIVVAKQLETFGVKSVANMQQNLEALLRADSKVYINTLALAARLTAVAGIFQIDFGSSILAIASPPVLHVMANDLKIPNGYFGTEAHQDWASTQGSLRTTTVWIPITNTHGNFPLEVVRGSHKCGLCEGESNGSVLEIKWEDTQFEPVNAQFGDIVLMSGFLVHRTGTGGTGLRMAASIRYEDVIEPNFIRRGYPNAQKRTVNREILWYPSSADVEESLDVG